MNTKDIAKKALDLLKMEYLDADVKLYLKLDENPLKKYEVRDFDIYFTQPSDHKGQPQNEIQGGLIEFSIPEIPDDIINKWMLSSTKQMSGTFSFERVSMSSALKIIFENSYCVSYNKTIGNGGAITRLRISPSALNVNGKGKIKIWAF